MSAATTQQDQPAPYQQPVDAGEERHIRGHVAVAEAVVEFDAVGDDDGVRQTNVLRAQVAVPVADTSDCNSPIKQ
jgi:hypothetical protein